jgi:hypothetical protein
VDRDKTRANAFMVIYFLRRDKAVGCVEARLVSCCIHRQEEILNILSFLAVPHSLKSLDLKV